MNAGHSGNASVLLNHGDGTFAEAVNYPAGNETVDAEIATITALDWDGDGRLDLSLLARDGTLTVLLATCVP